VATSAHPHELSSLSLPLVGRVAGCPALIER
jgi:hypothetical protein